ncbi:MAG: PhoU family transcriptional regulator [Planctomycetes bacterium]|nr:PhoU family transcriptional regulator [Planctomycetota bacterium]
MFKQLFTAWKSGEMLDQAFSQFHEMLGHARWMFIRANEVLRRRVAANEVKDSIYRRDQSINELLRSIRRKIVRHLTINPGGDAAACLALMSVAKDAERIGDYCKNVFEVGQFYTKDFRVPRYHEPLESIRLDVERLFEAVITAFQGSDDTAAKAAIESADSIRGECDDVVSQLLADEASIQTHEAVAYSLLARHYKRVSSHLANISTAVLGRIEDLDFRS